KWSLRNLLVASLLASAAAIASSHPSRALKRSGEGSGTRDLHDLEEAKPEKRESACVRRWIGGSRLGSGRQSCSPPCMPACRLQVSQSVAPSGSARFRLPFDWSVLRCCSLALRDSSGVSPSLPGLVALRIPCCLPNSLSRQAPAPGL